MPTFSRIVIESVKKYIKNNPKKSIVWGAYTGLGFYRGVSSQMYMIEDSNKTESERAKIYNREFIPEKPLFSVCFLHGMAGAIVYNNIFIMPITLFKEAYRLEVNLRNLEEEKKSSKYKSIF